MIVLDNYQDVPADSLFHEVVRDGLSVVPEGITVVIVSRADPPPPYARLQAGSRLKLMPREEIWFTFEETGALVEARGGKRPSDAVLKELVQRTEGWAAGLVLISERIAQDGGLPMLGDMRGTGIYDYLATELFERAEPELKGFLLQTSFLPRMTAKIALELTGNMHADRILARLTSSNFFIQRHATPGLVYQYHPLFREFLLSQARESLGRDETISIKKKAALLLLQSGQIESAADLLVEAGDWDGFIPLVLANARSLAGQGRFATLMDWIERIPKSIFESRPWLAFWSGVCKKPVNPPQGRALLEQAFAQFEKQHDAVGLFLSWAEIVDTFLYEWNDFKPLDRWIEWLDERMKNDPSFPAPAIEALVASSMVDALVFRRPDHQEIKQWVERASNQVSKIENTGMRIQARLHIINYYLWMGDYANSLKMAEEIKNISQEPAATPFIKIVHHWLESAFTCIISGDFNASLHHVEKGLEIGSENGIHVWNHMLLTFGAFSVLNMPDMEAANAYLQRVRSITIPGAFHNIVAQHDITAWSSFLLGDFVQAAIASEEGLAEASRLGMKLHVVLFHIILARIYHAGGDDQRSADHFTKAQRSVQRSGSIMLEFMFLLAEAHFVLNRGDDKAGKEVLRKAMSLGRSRNLVSHGFWWDPRMMSYLCAKALEEGIEVEYVRRLVRKRNLVPDRSFPVPETWPLPVRVYTLGRFELLKNDKPVVFAGKVQKKPLELLKALIAFGGTDVPEARLLDALWPEAEGDGAKQSFDTTLHRLRKLLADDEAITVRDSQLSLDRRRVWVDAWAFERLLCDAEDLQRAGAGQPQDAAVPLMERALALYQGHFLPAESRQDWSMSRRERLHAKFLKSLSGLAGQWQLQDECGRAVDLLRKGLEIDELAEELYRQLMVCYIRLGRESDTVKTYHRCRAVLSRAFGMDPSTRTRELYAAIRQQG